MIVNSDKSQLITLKKKDNHESIEKYDLAKLFSIVINVKLSPSKKFFLFDSMIALLKCWKMLFISS